jgi:hypothetical protein
LVHVLLPRLANGLALTRGRASARRVQRLVRQRYLQYGVQVTTNSFVRVQE